MKSIEKLAAGSVGVRNVASQLSDMLKRIEVWLSKLPGRVHTEIKINEAEDPRGLKFTRDGNTWILLATNSKGEWRSLLDMDLNTKIIVAWEIARLIEAMSTAQKDLHGRIENTITHLHEFAEANGFTFDNKPTPTGQGDHNGS